MKVAFFCFLISCAAFAGQTEDGVLLRNNALNALQIFNPNSVIPNFTQTPTEANLKPNEGSGNQVLQQEANNKITKDDTARFVMMDEHQRAKITANDKAFEIVEGTRLIDAAEGVVHPGCHKEPVPCEEKVVEKTCEENRSFKPVTCTRHLNVHLNAFNHSEVSRIFVRQLSTIDLTQCTSQDIFCTPNQLVQLHPECEHLKVRVHLNRFHTDAHIIKEPTCQDPTLTIAEDKLSSFFKATIQVTEYRTEDNWEGDACEAASNQMCLLEDSNACLEPNQTKIIDGVSVTRHCWGEERKYQCVGEERSNCNALLENGCSNIRAECLSKIGDYCVLMSKVFQCTERTCFPDKEVCSSEVIHCANGSCDNSKIDESDDINEGVGRLGTLAGTATEVAQNQVQSYQPSIFKGAPQECEQYILNLRDCCRGNGLLEDFIHCPRDMQDLQRAKIEHRAIYLGHYKHHLLGTTRYVYCVFPTKLSGIVQIQGRLNQLQIPFGEAEKPNCRGITPEELERIDFKQLDIHEMVDELVSQKVFPNSDGITNANESHAKILSDKGEPYDK